MNRDLRLLLVARGLRLFASGLVSVIVVLYVTEAGLPEAAAGVILASALAGSVVTTAVISAVGDRIGRRRLMVATAAMMAAGGAVFASADVLWLLAVSAFVSMLNPNGGETGSAIALEQSAMAEAVPPSRRTTIFVWANLVASAATAIGSLAAAAPAFLQDAGIEPLASYRFTLWTFAVVNLFLVFIFLRLSPAVEPARRDDSGKRPWMGLGKSRGLVMRFTSLLALNSFGAAFVVQALVAYWFHTRFGASAGALGVIFFMTNVVGSASYLLASKIADRIGLVNTMVFTHLPSNILLMLVPFMPSLPLAAMVLVMRHSLSQMDRPARDSYTMGIVASAERTATAGVTKIGTDAGAAAGVALAGAAAQFLAPGSLFVIAGALRIVYNAGLYSMFHRIPAPEERADASKERAGAADLDVTDVR